MDHYLFEEIKYNNKNNTKKKILIKQYSKSLSTKGDMKL